MYTKLNKKTRFCIFLFTLCFVLSDLPYSGNVFAQMASGVSSGGTADTSMPTADAASALPRAGNVTVNFRGVDINMVLHYLSEVSGVDIVPHPEVQGEVTMRLRDKPWEDALSIVTRNHECVYSWEGDIIRIIPVRLLQQEETVTEVIRLKNLAREVELVAGAQSTGRDDVGVEQTERSVEQLMRSINSLLSSARGENATFIPGVNAIVITAIPSKMREIKKIVDNVDTRPQQIILDAKVIEINLRKDERFGVDWNAVATAAGARRPITFPFNTEGLIGFLPGMQRRFYPSAATPKIDPATGDQIGDMFVRTDDSYFHSIQQTALPFDTDMSEDMFSFGTLDFSSFTATLQLLDKRGDTEVLSSPRITALNNQKATIKVIDKVMLQQSVRATETGTTLTVQFEPESSAREVGVKLTVIPRVNDHGEITVNLLPEVSSNISFTTLSVGAGQNTVALQYDSREANTIVRVNDGDTIFLGGLIRRTVATTENKLPILGDIFGGIPIVGNIFKYEAEDVSRTEVVFFVTVHIVKDNKDWIDFTETGEYYEKYIVREGRDKFGDLIDPSAGTGKAVIIEKGEVMDMPQTVDIDHDRKKERKPFLDFRD